MPVQQGHNTDPRKMGHKKKQEKNTSCMEIPSEAHPECSAEKENVQILWELSSCKTELQYNVVHILDKNIFTFIISHFAIQKNIKTTKKTSEIICKMAKKKSAKKRKLSKKKITRLQRFHYIFFTKSDIFQ